MLVTIRILQHCCRLIWGHDLTLSQKLPAVVGQNPTVRNRCPFTHCTLLHLHVCSKCSLIASKFARQVCFPDIWTEHSTVCQVSNVQPSGQQPLHAWRHICNWLLQIYSKQNQSYAIEPTMPTKQKQTQTLNWCLEHPKNGVYATLNMVPLCVVCPWYQHKS